MFVSRKYRISDKTLTVIFKARYIVCLKLLLPKKKERDSVTDRYG